MSREIKFRAYDKKHGTMGRVISISRYEEIKDATEVCYYVGSKTSLQDISNTARVAVMQFTGLFDKQGVEIYEGDLFIDDHNEEIGEAVFDDGSYWVDWSNPVLLSEINACYFVAGNIYEHQNLLENNNESP